MALAERDRLKSTVRVLAEDPAEINWEPAVTCSLNERNEERRRPRKVICEFQPDAFDSICFNNYCTY